MPPTITETVQITIQFSDTANINLTTVTTNSIYATSGTIYLPYPWAAYDPYLVLASFALFLYIGAAMGKPTLTTIVWGVLLFSGVFFLSGAIWQFIIVNLAAAAVLYWGLKRAQQT